MKPETQGKLMVAMVVSILAFGFGTVAVLLTGQYQTLDSTTTLNTTKQSDLPPITNTNQNNQNTSTSQNSPSNQNNQPSNSQNNNPTTGHNNTTTNQ